MEGHNSVSNRYKTKSEIPRSYGNYFLKFCFYFLRKLHTGFHSNYSFFIYLTIVHKDSLFSTSFTTLVISFFDSSHHSGCEVLSHCGFDLHFPNLENLVMNL